MTITATAALRPPAVTAATTGTGTGPTSPVGQRRYAQPNRSPLPVALAIFASSRISSACSCIVTPTTRTTTTTQTHSVAGPQITVTAAAATVTATTTTTLQITEVETTTATNPAATVTVTAATMVIPILVEPQICNARGQDSPNALNYNTILNVDRSGCLAACVPDRRCLSTAFYLEPGGGTSTPTCRLYDKSVTDTAQLGSGFYIFNDKACYVRGAGG